MKYIKTFEKPNIPYASLRYLEIPKIGDYVIINLNTHLPHTFKGDRNGEHENETIYDLFRNNIGKILKLDHAGKNDCHINVKYVWDKDSGFDDELCYTTTYDFWVSFSEIEFYSNDKEDVEAYLEAKKYNL